VEDKWTTVYTVHITRTQPSWGYPAYETRRFATLAAAKNDAWCVLMNSPGSVVFIQEEKIMWIAPEVEDDDYQF
jgi:hypothetical protein